MKSIVGTCLALCLLTGTPPVQSETSTTSSSASQDRGTPLVTLIEAVAKRTGKTFFVNPTVMGQPLIIGQDPSRITYEQLLLVLRMMGFSAVPAGDHIVVIPDPELRQWPTPVVTGTEKLPEAQFVNTVIHVKNVPAAHLVPILRPLVPRYGHLAAVPCNNTLLLGDTFGNVKRLEAVIQALDVGEPYKPEKCEMFMRDSHETPSNRDPAPAPGRGDQSLLERQRAGE